MKRLTVFLVVLIAAVMVVPVNGTDLTGKFGLSVHPGIFKPVLTDSSDIWAVGFEGSVTLKYGLTPNVAVGVMGTYALTKTADLTDKPDGAGFTFTTDPDGAKFNAMMVDAVAFYHFMPEEKFNPYVFGGAGIAFWNVKENNGDPYWVYDTTGTDSFELKDQELTAVIGIGLDYYVVENIALNIGAKAHYLTHILTSLKDEKDADELDLDLPKLIPEAYVGATFYFGKPKDGDKDAVPDKVDQCPDTPLGAMVDENGCPLDSDNDGIYDGLDNCAASPRGAKVDVNGCPMDSDGDGVFDGLDNCANTPKGVKVDAKGCPIDTDGDGVYDYMDKEMNTPKGAKVDANGVGIDSDKDGVYDGIDQCSGTPAGIEVDKLGCPIVSKFIPEPEKPVVLQGVHFELNKSVLAADSKTILDEVAASLIARPDVKVEIGGHCDWMGSDEYNLKLSNGRADAVMQYLISKGVKADNLTAKGYGETQPIGDNNTEEGRAKNRRVEMKRM